MADDEGQLTILVIDDDEAMRRLLADVISKRSHQVVLAESAEEGLALLPHWTFQIAFLDHNLPGMEGLLFGEYLRRNNPDMTIAMVTGSDDPKIRKRSQDLHLAFIAKPFEVASILRLIDDYVSLARSRDEQRKRVADPDYAPPLSAFADDLAEAFGIPNVPKRIEDRLIESTKRSLSNLRTASRYTERDRVIALGGLIAARVLGMSLPRASAERSLFEEYDYLMRQRGRRTEFEP